MPLKQTKFMRRAYNIFSGFSSWLIIGLSFILIIAVAFFAIRNTERAKNFMIKNYIDRANALIWALEAGARTRMGFQSENRHLQPLLEETARQPDIKYLMITDDRGVIIAHSNVSMINKLIKQKNLLNIHTNQTIWRINKDSDENIFEVQRLFSPLKIPRYGSLHMKQAHSQINNANIFCTWMQSSNKILHFDNPTTKLFVFVGFDQKPFTQSLTTDFHNNLLVAFLVLLAGFGGFISLFWAHNFRKSHRMLKDTQAISTEVVTNLPVGLLTSDKNTNLLIANPVAMKMLGIKTNQLGNMLAQLGGLNWNEIITHLKNGGTVLEKELELQGSNIPISLSASTIRNEDGIHIGYIFILQNLDEVKSLQAEIRRNERLALLGNIAAGVAHEIRNPLSSIKGFATYIGETFQTEEAAKEAVDIIILEVDRLNRVVSELLNFANPAHIKLTNENINQVITQSIIFLEEEAKAKNIIFKFKPNNKLPKVKLNTERFTQALLNLLLNAIQSIELNGEIKINVFVSKNSNELNIEITDNGSGISDAVKASIFTPYFTTKNYGTGLGLAIVYQIIQGHAGRIKVKSQLKIGTTFTIFLPLNNISEDNNGKC